MISPRRMGCDLALNEKIVGHLAPNCPNPSPRSCLPILLPPLEGHKLTRSFSTPPPPPFLVRRTSPVHPADFPKFSCFRPAGPY